MIIQPVIFPKEKLCEEISLYYKTDGEIDCITKEENHFFCFREKSKISFLAYFNLLSVGKWKKYTNVHDIGIRLCYKGTFKVTILKADKEGVQGIQTYNLPFSEQKREILLNCPNEIKDGILAFQMRALEDGSCFYEGDYIAKGQEKQVSLALNICTYCREEFLKRNVQQIQQYLLEEKLTDKIDIFIIDNAGELDEKEWNQENLYLISNINAGGSGGFARGMMEILKQQKRHTHLINMDDDIVVDPRILFRTMQFLSVIKEEYSEYFVGASMLRLDDVYVQEEAGGRNLHGKYKACKQGLDLRKTGNLIENEQEEQTDYCAWWYSCMPVFVVKKIGLPLPLFIHCDDVEYGLRNGSRNIFLNGIAVWHQAFDQKRESSVYYYDLRNRLICDAVGRFGMGKRRIQIRVIYSVLMSLFMYRYRDIAILEKAVDDYFKGPEWLLACEPEKLHQQIRQMGYKMKDVTGLLNKGGEKENAVHGKTRHTTGQILKMMLTLNGWLLPSRKKQVYPVVIGAFPSELARKKKVVLYNPEDGRGICVSKNWRFFLKGIKAMLRMCRRVQREYDTKKKEYARYQTKLVSEEMWKELFASSKQEG